MAQRIDERVYVIETQNTTLGVFIGKPEVIDLVEPYDERLGYADYVEYLESEGLRELYIQRFEEV